MRRIDVGQHILEHAILGFPTTSGGVVTITNYFSRKRTGAPSPDALETTAYLMLAHIAISETTLDFVFTPHRMVIFDMSMAIIMARILRIHGQRPGVAHVCLVSSIWLDRR